ncbi:MAG: phosphate acetyltransferase [Clostridiales bacterium]|nr:phosphate acetyltransferase [Clostridiales bacterium]
MAEKAATDKKTIVLPESTDMRTIKAAAIVCEKGFADVILLGNEKNIKEMAGDLDISKALIIDHITSPEFKDYAALYQEMRKSKGMTLEEATETMKNPLYYGAMMVQTGAAHGMVAGAINSTPNTLRPALQIIKTAKTSKIVSSFLAMVIPDCEFGFHGNFVFSDCGLVENPSADELAEIAIASAKSFKTLFNEEPIVAMLSYSTYGSAKSPLTEKVIEATRLAKERAPELMIDGEIQADAAIVPSIGQFKAPGSKVAGKANVLIFPDLNAGNICCKLVERLAKGELYGPVTQGLNKPINDLSRGCKAEDIAGAVAITAVQAQQVGK